MKDSAMLGAGLLLAALASNSAQAQRLGLRAGANYANLAGNIQNEATYNNKIGFVGGLILNAPLVGEVVSLQPEVLYSQKGFENKPTAYTGLLGGTQKREGSVTYNYLDVPVLARVKAGGLIAELGPQYSFLLSANDQTRITTTPALGGAPTTTEAQNQRDVSGLNRHELGYVAGIGFESVLGLSVSLRYTGALSDFVKNDNSTYFNGDLKNARHSAFQLSLGLLLPGE